MQNAELKIEKERPEPQKIQEAREIVAILTTIVRNSTKRAV